MKDGFDFVGKQRCSCGPLRNWNVEATYTLRSHPPEEVESSWIWARVVK